MGEKIVVGPINRGFKNSREPFVIDNDSFPTLVNAYQWRGRIKRKRGTGNLGRLQRIIGTTDGLGDFSATILPANLDSGVVSFSIGDDIFVDGGGANPVVLTTNSSGTGTLNRVTGALTITGSIADTAVFYYPGLPVMGLEDFERSTNAFLGTVAFDTTYSYSITTSEPYNIYDVSFYKNLATGTYAGYIQKSVWTPTTWNGEDYQQFWTTNYEGALWATNGINTPFDTTNIGMQYKLITGVVIDAAGPPALATLTIVAHGLVQGDFVFINEVDGITGINFQTGYVVSADPQAANTVQVEFPNATLGGAYITDGIAQYLTNRSDVTKDSLRWFDGDPVDGAVPTPVFSTGRGWVNFAPPLSQESYSIAGLPEDSWYLVGARMIIPFKDRLLFIGPVVQTSSAGSQRYLQDTVIYSQNGTPYYTASFTGDPVAATTVFHPILVPVNQTSTPTAYWADQTGFGGFVSAGISQRINTTSANDDVLIMGLDTTQVRFVYTGNDIIPFVFYIINSELGSSSTFSAINMDRGVITRGSRGFVMTNQVECNRIDEDIPDQVFQINLKDNGTERICSQRDYINEWIYFTYPKNNTVNKFPNQTLQYNYKDNSWAIFNESYTHYGIFRRQTGFTWATVGTIYESWGEWNDPWDAGESSLLKPEIIAGNQQGFVMFLGNGTGEGTSLYITNFSSSVVTSPNHGLNLDDFIIITDVLGTIGTQVNNKIFSVSNITINTFTLNPTITTGTYLGGGVITRMYRPFVQTRQFPVAWGLGRKTRLGAQQYLLTRTPRAQITLLIYLSQNNSNAYNDGPIVPSVSSQNDSLVYSTVLFTCPESTNLGLTPANTNLQMLTQLSSSGESSNNQQQIWHRVNTSLIGDTVQLGFTLSEEQMRDLDDEGNPISQFEEIDLHGFIIDVTPSQLLS